MAALVPFPEALRLDAELVRLARGASALRLAVGSALDALAAAGGHHELGFSSFEAYARERCARSGRWAADTRWLAQKLDALPQTRDALRAGVIGWSTAELLARNVSPQNERTWLERAQSMTVRELRKLLALETNGDAPEEGEEEEMCTLRMSVTREDAWLFECTRKVAHTVAGRTSADDLLQTLLAEGLSTLLELVPEDARAELHDLEELEHDVAHDMECQAAWRSELGRWRDEAEELCQESCTSGGTEARAAEIADVPSCPGRTVQRRSIASSINCARSSRSAISHSEPSPSKSGKQTYGGGWGSRRKLNMRESASEFPSRH